MKMDKKYYHTLKETLFHEQLDNGLNVYLLKKEGFIKTYGIFTANFGSNDNEFIPRGQSDFIRVNDGIAHFLEHKMFYTKDGVDANELYAKLGASSNAYTTNNQTSYLFSTTQKESECIELLLDFVQALDLTEEAVEKEKGIIEQEIKMYDDDPSWRLYFGSIAALYVNHPNNTDIAGTVESVNRITKAELDLCYETFYHPDNMMLFIVGNIDIEDTMTLIRANQNQKQFAPRQEIVRKKADEPDHIAVKYQEIKMDVNVEKLFLSIKVNDVPSDPIESLRRDIAFNLFFDCVFAKSSDLYNSWLEQGLINSTFETNFTQSRETAFIQMGGDCEDLKTFEETLIEFVANIDQITIDEATFLRLKKRDIGNFILAFNSIEPIASNFSRYYYEGVNAFEVVDVMQEITLDEVLAVRKFFNEKLMAITIIKK